MSVPVVLRPEAQDELDDAYAWYERQRMGLGEQFLSAVQDVLDRIGEYPEAYAVVHRDARRGLVRHFPYSILYRVEADRVTVVGVFHGRRHPRSLGDRLR